MVMPCIIHCFANALWKASTAVRPFAAGAFGGISTPSGAKSFASAAPSWAPAAASYADRIFAMAASSPPCCADAPAPASPISTAIARIFILCLLSNEFHRHGRTRAVLQCHRSVGTAHRDACEDVGAHAVCLDPSAGDVEHDLAIPLASSTKLLDGGGARRRDLLLA